MLLLIDAGNTRVKWVLAQDKGEPGQWVASGSVTHDELPQLRDAWAAQPFSRAVVANVAGSAVRAALERLLPVAPEWFASVPALAGVRNAYRNPAQLGCDRFAAAIGARALYPRQALIVATCGTATTVDAIDEEGVFLGGMILPGLRLMTSSLASNTAQLPEIAELDVQTPFADNTGAAIASGCLSAQAGAIERAVRLHARPHRAVRCLLSGGAAAAVAPHLQVPHERVDNLVLVGLHVAAMEPRC